jgi:hypothetical protein
VPPSSACAPDLPLGLTKCTTSLLSLKTLTSSMPGIVLTPRRLRVFCKRLSSVLVVLWTAFFFLQPQQVPQACQPGFRASPLQYSLLGHHAPPHGALAASAHGASHLHELIAIHDG